MRTTCADLLLHNELAKSQTQS